MSIFLKVNCDEVRDILLQKKAEASIQEESNVRYYNFLIMDLIQRIGKEDDLSLTKLFAGFFDLDIHLEDSKITLEDFKKVNQTLSEFEKYLNDNIQTDGVLYLARYEDGFSIMYYEILN